MAATVPSRMRPSLIGVVAVAAACAFSIALTGCGPSGEVSSSKTGGDLFDSSRVHEISVTFAQEDYEAMVETYESSGEKEWISATVEIDGRAYRNVGLRLKGNSSIMGLRRGGVTRGPSGGSSVDAPEGLPWLIRLDKNIDGQNYHGIFDLVVRSNATKTSLNEAVSLELLQMAGLASQRAIAVRFTVNGSAATLRLVTENPDDVWMTDNLDAGGALYKAESTGDYSYRGTDPDSYDDVFDQEAGKYTTDLKPLIGFLDFINNSDDATFNTQLGDRLDLKSFATYLAMETLLDNFDDIDGPGNNSYLYYDPATGIFTVVPWDHNLALGGFNGGGNGPGIAQPGGFNGGGGVAPAQPGGEVGERGMAPQGSPSKSNILATRFHANPDFEASYQEQIIELTEQLYESGAAADVLAKWMNLLKTQAPDLVDSSTVEQEAAKIATFFTSH